MPSKNWLDNTDWERYNDEYFSPSIIILPDNKVTIMPQNTINIKYEDLEKLKVSDVEPDALYIISTRTSEYNNIKTGKDLIRIINGANKLFVQSRVQALDKIRQSKANLYDLEDSKDS